MSMVTFCLAYGDAAQLLDVVRTYDVVCVAQLGVLVQLYIAGPHTADVVALAACYRRTGVLLVADHRVRMRNGSIWANGQRLRQIVQRRAELQFAAMPHLSEESAARAALEPTQRKRWNDQEPPHARVRYCTVGAHRVCAHKENDQ